MKSVIAGLEWPAIPDDTGALALAVQFQLKQTEWLSVAELKRLQLQQLGLVLKHAYETMPFWRTRLTAAGFRPQDELSSEILSALPVLTRDEVQKQGDALLCRSVPTHHGSVSRGETSGSTGKPITHYSTELTQFFWRAFTLRDHLWHRRDFSGKLAAIRTTVEDKLVKGWGPATDPVFETGHLATLKIRADIKEQLNWLRREAPQYLVTYPRNLLELARESIESGVKLPTLREARSYGTVLPPDLRATCRRAWDVGVVDMYSATEVGYIALQCPKHEHYHVQAENLIVEVLDDNGTECTPGHTGRVVLSTLHNFAMPLIRYEIGDYAEIGGTCDCGRNLPVITRILGRDRNIMVRPDGSRHWPRFSAELWTAVAPIRQFRLIQKNRDTIEAQFVADDDLGDEQQETLKRSLQESLGYPFDIRLLRVEEIPRGANFKYEDFVSEIRP